MALGDLVYPLDAIASKGDDVPKPWLTCSTANNDVIRSWRRQPPGFHHGFAGWIILRLGLTGNCPHFLH